MPLDTSNYALGAIEFPGHDQCSSVRVAAVAPSRPRNKTIQTKQPRAAPTFRCLPERVSGIPILRESRAFAAEMPINLLQENPPLFILAPLCPRRLLHMLQPYGAMNH
jgi:hypothetical protein